MNKMSYKTIVLGLSMLAAGLVVSAAPLKASAETLPPTGSQFRLLGTRATSTACFVRVEIMNNTGGEREYPRLVSPSPLVGTDYEVRPYVFANAGRNVVETKFPRTMVGAKYLVFVDAWRAPTFQVAGGICSASQMEDQPAPWKYQG